MFVHFDKNSNKNIFDNITEIVKCTGKFGFLPTLALLIE